MPEDFAPPSKFARGAAIAGGVFFAGSLGYFAYSYVRFGQPSGPGSWRDGWRPAALDIVLFSAFALHHSLFARVGLKAFVERHVSPALERTTYVWISTTLFVAVCAWWQPVPGVLWTIDSRWWWLTLAPLQIAGGLITARAAAKLDVLDLAGVRQALGQSPRERPGLASTGLFALVRHPLYLGWILLVWPVGTMTGTRLVFAAFSTVYVLVAIQFEERDLRRTFGQAYDAYSRRVRWKIVPFVY